MTKQELELLLNMAGIINTITNWGAWITPALESLKENEYITTQIDQHGVHYKLTPKGINEAQSIAQKAVKGIINSDYPPLPLQSS